MNGSDIRKRFAKTSLIHTPVPASISRRNGQALVPVIFVMLILTVVGVAFSVSSHHSAQASNNYVAQTQRFYAARGTLNYVMSALAQTSNNGATYGYVPPLPDTDSNGWAQVGDAWVKVETIDTGSCINLNTATLTTLQKIPVFRDNTDLANAVIQWRTPTSSTTGTTTGSASGSAAASSSSSSGASDPYQSLSPAYAVKGANFDTVEELLLIQGMTPTILYGSPAGTPISPQDSENNPPTANSTAVTGSSSSSSSSLSTTGSTRALLKSRSANRTRQAATVGAANPATPRPATPTGATTARPGTGTGGAGAGTGAGTAAATPEDFSDVYTSSTLVMANLFTTVGRERNVSSDGTPRLDMNTATAQQMQDQLGLTAQQANGVVQYRNRVSANSAGPVAARPGAATTPAAPTTPPQAARPATINTRSIRDEETRQAATTGRPPTGTLGATPGTPATPAAGTGNARPGGTTGGTAGGGAAAGPAFKTIADLLQTAAFTRTVMQTAADRVSVDDKVFHDNLVNINTAPPEVLATVPGMTHNIISEILTYRQGGQTFQDLGDFFSLQNLQRTDFQAVIAGLTTKTSTYIVHIKVRMTGQQSVYAISALVEMTDAGPHILQWHEVPRTPGWSTWLKPLTLQPPTPGQNSSGTGGKTATAK